MKINTSASHQLAVVPPLHRDLGLCGHGAGAAVLPSLPRDHVAKEGIQSPPIPLLDCDGDIPDAFLS